MPSCGVRLGLWALQVEHKFVSVRFVVDQLGLFNIQHVNPRYQILVYVQSSIAIDIQELFGI